MQRTDVVCMMMHVRGRAGGGAGVRAPCTHVGREREGRKTRQTQVRAGLLVCACVCVCVCVAFAGLAGSGWLWPWRAGQTDRQAGSARHFLDYRVSTSQPPGNWHRKKDRRWINESSSSFGKPATREMRDFLDRQLTMSWLQGRLGWVSYYYATRKGENAETRERLRWNEHRRFECKRVVGSLIWLFQRWVWYRGVRSGQLR